MFLSFIDYNMLFCKENESDIFHIHIPRTGGRFLRELFRYNSYKMYHSNYNTFVQGIECPHLHFPLYNLLEGVEECPHITIVRNPFERFKSTMNLIIRGREYPEEVYELLKDKEWLFDFINFEMNVGPLYKSNIFRPQNEFISEKTLIYKFEDGLNENLTSWIEKNTNIKLRYANVFYEKGPHEFKTNQNELEIDSSVEILIKEYYKKDYEVFNYE